MFLVYVFTLILSGCTLAQRVVDTEYGQVRGHVINVNNGITQTTVDVFHGIPYAKDTSGARRFANPESPDPWTDIFEADVIRPMCPQPTEAIEYTHPHWDSYSEDCLHVNIYTPGDAADPYPVMFWLHGGSYQTGGNLQYPGHFLASHGVAVVTVNYRLGKFGFAYTGNGACPGNAGMWDQNMALKFVINNIANFGGDPSRITVFGESAGAGSTSLHLLSPQSKDLFHQAILESGAETNDWVVNPPASNPEDYTHQIAEDLGCLRTDDYQMMDCMRQLPWQEILFNSTSTCTPGYVCLGMVPVVDGPGGFLPEMPVDMRKSGSVMNGPIISGINEEDGSLGAAFFTPGINTENCCNRTYFTYALRENIVGLFEARLSNSTADEIYHAFDYNYTPWPHIHDTDANRASLVQIITDYDFGVSWDRQLKDHQSVAPTYGYLYDHSSANTTFPEWAGTIHTAELHSVWGLPMLSFNEEVCNDSLFLCDAGLGCIYNYDDIQYSIFIQTLWTNFAKYGNPTPSPVVNPLGGATTWPQFTNEAMDLLYFGEESIGVITEYRQQDYAFWTDYLMWMAGDELR